MNWTYKPLFNPALNGHIPAFHNNAGWTIYNTVIGNWAVINPKRVTYVRRFRTAQTAMNWVNSIIGVKEHE